ncbi:MAG: T9SS type A sorting domain-containing protein [bacterium]
MITYLRKTIVLLLFLASPPLLLAQYPNIRVSQPGSIKPEEVTISINPTNPLNLAAGANIDYYYYSMDGGLTWVEGHLTSTLGVWGDPCVAFDSAGNLYFSHLSNPADGDWLDRIVVQKSIDGEMSWNDGVGVGLNPPKDQDKEWLTADLTDSPFRNNLYMAWTEFDRYGSPDPNDSTRILFSRSIDFGETWSQPIKVSDVGGDCLDGDNTVEGAVPAVGPDGEIYLSWAGPLGIVFDKSTDGGLTFGKDTFVTSQPGGWNFEVPGIYRCNGLPVTACDISNSTFRGNIYIAWSDQRNGTDNTNVFFIKSTNGGESWSEIKRVNDDTTKAQQFFPWMTVDPVTGIIYFVFYDRRNTHGNETEVYVAKSENGGESFTNFRVSESSFTTTPEVFFGDYINIAARDGMVYPIWTRMDGFDLSVWMAIIDMTVDVELVDEPNVIDDFELLQNYPNPFNPVTTISFQLPKTSQVNLSIYNIKGQLVRTLLNEKRTAGHHSVTWKANGVGSGIYFYRITAGNYSAVKKCTILK